MEAFLKKQYGDVYGNLPQDEKTSIIKNVYLDMKNPKSNESLIENISNAIFYPETKAIAQLVLHKVDDLPTEEISYEELQKIPSKRGSGVLGSSGK